MSPHYVVCAQPEIEARSEELNRLGCEGDGIGIGILVAQSDMVWLGVEPLPDGQAFNLDSWDEPTEREPGWHSFKGANWVANALNLRAWRVAP